jgi:hypothetical protein
MSMINLLPRHRHSLAALALAMLTGCATSSPEQRAQVPLKANPSSPPVRTVTGFSSGLTCMDEMMFDQGTRDVTVMLEELQDSTKRLGIGTRDMMISAISDMSRRSRGVRVSVFGSDSQNLTNAVQQAQRLNAFQVLPEYDIRGSISQLDEDVAKRASGFGLLTEVLFGARFGSEERLAVLAFDASVARTEDFTLVPGVVSKNTIVVARKEASAGEGSARIRKADLTFSFSVSNQDGMAQSLRNLVELSAVELVGKLVKLPYWQCLGVSDTAPEVQREMTDWFLGMEDEERVRYFKERMRERRYFNGAIDASRTQAFENALMSFRSALGLPVTSEMDEALFHASVLRRAPKGSLKQPARIVASKRVVEPANPAASPAPQPDAETPAEPASVFLAANATVVDAASPIRLTAMANVPGYLYCYTADPDSGKIQRIFPNRFQEDPHVDAGQPVVLPGEGSFRLNVGPAQERKFACMHTTREIYSDLPAALRWGDFEDIGLKDFDAVRNRFAEVSGQPVGFSSIGVRGRRSTLPSPPTSLPEIT